MASERRPRPPLLTFQRFTIKWLVACYTRPLIACYCTFRQQKESSAGPDVAARALIYRSRLVDKNENKKDCSCCARLLFVATPSSGSGFSDVNSDCQPRWRSQIETTNRSATQHPFQSSNPVLQQLTMFSTSYNRIVSHVCLTTSVGSFPLHSHATFGNHRTL